MKRKRSFGGSGTSSDSDSDSNSDSDSDSEIGSFEYLLHRPAKIRRLLNHYCPTQVSSSLVGGTSASSGSSSVSPSSLSTATTPPTTTTSTTSKSSFSSSRKRLILSSLRSGGMAYPSFVSPYILPGPPRSFRDAILKCELQLVPGSGRVRIPIPFVEENPFDGIAKTEFPEIIRIRDEPEEKENEDQDENEEKEEEKPEEEEDEDEEEGPQLRLREFQTYGVNWLVSRYNERIGGCILSDEMGLGKTVMTSVFLLHHSLAYWRASRAAEAERQAAVPAAPTTPRLGPVLKHPQCYLVVCPLNLLSQWADEIQLWTRGRLRVLVLHETAGDLRETVRTARALLRKDSVRVEPDANGRTVPNDFVLVTTYHVVSALASFARDEKKRLALAATRPEFAANVPSPVRARTSPKRYAGLFLFSTHFAVAIFDEGHRLRNIASKTRRECDLIRAGFRVVLSGTPMQIDMTEVWSLLRFVFGSEKETVERIGSRMEFLLRYSQVDKVPQTAEFKLFHELVSRSQHAVNTVNFHDLHDRAVIAKSSEDWVREMRALPEQQPEAIRVGLFQQHVLGQFILKRKKIDVLDSKEIGSKLEIVLSWGLVPVQALLYRAIVENNQGILRASRVRVGGLSKVVHLLRDICLHPFLLPNAEDFIESRIRKQKNLPDDYEFEDKETNELLISCSIKMIMLDKVLEKVVRQSNEKVLIFTHRLDMLSILKDYCRYREYEYVSLQGKTKVSKRRERIRRFRMDPSIKLFLMSTMAGNLGLNLMSASTVILYDLHFNPFNDVQAQARAHRIGQTRDVKVFKLTTRGTVESQQMAVTGQRLGSEKALFTSGLGKANAKELSSILRNGVYAALDREEVDFDSLSLDDLIQGSSATFVSFAEDANKKVDLKDPLFWEKMFPDYVDVDMLENRFVKAYSFNLPESMRFVEQLEQVANQGWDQRNLSDFQEFVGDATPREKDFHRLHRLVLHVQEKLTLPQDYRLRLKKLRDHRLFQRRSRRTKPPKYNYADIELDAEPDAEPPVEDRGDDEFVLPQSQDLEEVDDEEYDAHVDEEEEEMALFDTRLKGGRRRPVQRRRAPAQKQKRNPTAPPSRSRTAVAVARPAVVVPRPPAGIPRIPQIPGITMPLIPFVPPQNLSQADVMRFLVARLSSLNPQQKRQRFQALRRQFVGHSGHSLPDATTVVPAAAVPDLNSLLKAPFSSMRQAVKPPGMYAESLWRGFEQRVAAKKKKKS